NVNGSPPSGSAAQYGLLLVSGTQVHVHGSTAINASYFGVRLQGVTSCTVTNSDVATNSTAIGVAGFSSEDASGCLYDSLRASGNNGDGFDLYSTSRAANFYHRLNASNNTMGSGIHLGPSQVGDILTNFVASGNSASGVYLDGAGQLGMQDLMGGTTNDNAGNGITVDSANLATLVSIVSSNNGGDGIYATASDTDTFYNIAATDNASWDVDFNNVNAASLGGILMVGTSGTPCHVSGIPLVGSLVDGTCTTSGTDGSSSYSGISSYAVLRPGRSLHDSFKGRVGTDDGVNLSDSSGAQSFSAVSDWLGFSSFFRGWGLNTAGSTWRDVTTMGACTSGTCRIWDWALSAATGNPLVGTVLDGVSQEDFFPSSACPGSANGAFGLTDGGSMATFQPHAIEWVGDFDHNPNGNQNGLCETGETCIWDPNFGAFPGEGSFAGRTCGFSGGTITGVEMHGFPRVARMDQIPMDPQISADDDDHLVIKTGTSVRNTRATEVGCHTTGKWYWEATIAPGTNLTGLYIGVGDLTMPLTVTSLGGTASSFGFELGTGTLYNGGVALWTNSTTYSAGQTVGIALDATSKQIWFTNGSGAWVDGIEPEHTTKPTTPAASSMGAGPFCPMAGFQNPGGLDFNLGQKGFKYRVPAGFNPGYTYN
ncbi:MAG TPA: SPRY domain-containing protein, partial [Bdellovibrionota bacterium]|nr:SPRY domain-containing protein [Bdellovibrionota bacterium]